MLGNTRGVKLYAPHHKGGILLFNVRDIPADDVGTMLSERGFCLRTGYHCAPLAHKAIGTDEGGAVRASFSIFNTASEVDALCKELKDISSGNF
jgi:selenocysteine lyase/cysteine desulfurase